MNSRDMRANMTPKMMPKVYRWLLSMSSLVFIVFAIEDGRGTTWGRFEQPLMMVTGLLVLYVAWRPSRKVNIVAAYMAVIATLFEVTAHLTQRNPNTPWVTASTMWITIGLYTVLLISFAWIRKSPR